MNKFIIGLILFALLPATGCYPITDSETPESLSGVKQTQVDIPVGSDGLTTEQRNVGDRLMLDNIPGSIKHLYIISAYSGQVLIYSTVRGKVTSSGKRLSPTTVSATDGNYVGTESMGIPVEIGGRKRRTTEVIQDDGTYGSSIEYLYWWDTKGTYHQQYVTGGMLLHVSDQPVAVKSVIINMELSQPIAN